MKKIGKFIIFLILKVIEEKFNIRLNNQAEIEIKKNRIFLNWIIPKKLLKIFIFINLISFNLKQKSNKIKKSRN